MDHRPVLVALAGPNGAGKTTFYFSILQRSGLRLVNADVIARELDLPPYRAAEAAARIRKDLIAERESFVFETVFSDPVGDKLSFLKQAIEEGYTVLLCFVGVASVELSEQRVDMRVQKGGHDVPSEKLVTRYPRVMANLKSAMEQLPNIWIVDNSDLEDPYRPIATIELGVLNFLATPIPGWLKPLFAPSFHPSPDR